MNKISGTAEVVFFGSFLFKLMFCVWGKKPGTLPHTFKVISKV